MFQTKFTVLHIKLNIYMQENKFTSDKQYLVLLYGDAKDTHIDQSVL